MTLRDSGTFKKSKFHSPRNTFATIMGIFDDPENHINQLLRHDDGGISLGVYSGGLVKEPKRKSMEKLS